MSNRMKNGSLLLLLIVSLAHSGCGDVVQVEDLEEIPTTIGETQEQDSDSKKTEPTTETATPEQDGFESAKPAKQDLATLLKKEKEEFAKQTIEIPKNWKRLSIENHIWADKENKRVIARGAICVQEGLLEMFACPRDTKEHEAIISVHAKAWEVHATLVALGIDPGKPVTWREKYVAVSGPIMNIEVWWMEDGKLVKRRAQDMMLNTNTEKPMQCDFVFGGSVQEHNEANGEHVYMANFGPMINVANQTDAMIDVSIQSSMDAADGLLFAANPKTVPPVNTKVYIVISDSGKQAVASSSTRK